MTATAPQQKITYTSANVDMEAFHQRLDEALATVRANLGKSYPLYINGKPVEGSGGGDPIVDTSPIDTSLVLGHFAAAGRGPGRPGGEGRHAAQKAWARRPWQERVAILRKAAALIRERKFDLAAMMSLEVGKSRLEAMGDAEESADLIDYYVNQVEEANGFIRPMAPMTPIEKNTEVLRPYGVFVCIAPFNFPLALSTGMSSAALHDRQRRGLQAGRGHPAGPGSSCTRSIATQGCRRECSTSCRGHGRDIGDSLWQHPGDRRRGLHRVQGSRHADLPRHQPEVGQALPDGAGRQERRDRDGLRRSRRRRRRRDEVRLRPAEPEVQRDQPGVRAPAVAQPFIAKAAREDQGHGDGRRHRRRTSTSAR